MKPFRIETVRFIKRDLDPEDIHDFHSYRSNPEVTKYQGFDVMNLEQAETFIQKNSKTTFGKPGEWVQFAIENKATGKLVGDCAIRLDANDIRIAETGITISHLEQRKGYAKEVMTGILELLFKSKGVLRVVEIVDAENTSSIKLLESLGFRKEGHCVENIFFKGKWGSEFQYAMLKWEWEKTR